MEAINFVGIQAAGKSSFYKERFFNTHLRINLDMLRTRHRERVLLRACIDLKQPFVDNTNPTVEERASYIAPAQAAGFRVVGYYFQSRVQDCLARIERRDPRERVPDRAIGGTARRLQLPSLAEGIDMLRYVRIAGDGSFLVEEWADEV
jgi:predicted kinase